MSNSKTSIEDRIKLQQAEYFAGLQKRQIEDLVREKAQFAFEAGVRIGEHLRELGWAHKHLGVLARYIATLGDKGELPGEVQDAIAFTTEKHLDQIP